MTVLLVLHCVSCRGEREFEQPPCLDGHGVDCPELACVECGMAVVVPWSELDAELAAAPELRAAG
jgi:hypothetical protein